MVLAVDIGNTNIVLALFKGKRFISELRIPTNPHKGIYVYKNKVLNFVKSNNKSETPQAIIVSSVVPGALASTKKMLAANFDTVPLILGESIKAPIKNEYRKPGQVGQDRLVNAFAVLCFYRKPAIILDFGTAVTIDVLSKEGSYLGGVIVPGVELSIENLTRRAALLPYINLRKPKDILGQSTVESMLSGIFYGYAALCDGIIDRLKRRLKIKPIVIATGGHSKLLSSYCKNIDAIDPHLTLKGLNLIYLTISKKS
ncbi:MAG: pantothenate kinase [Candidatus Omnitrophica bacterium CG07_land_8_20_14_0_80_42_15]|uniref:Type III pantothenate kinase n=1 Tax=Candidatus Aquitaenariimonas noxiae TaxID=1974741 RepID=A0A2J0KVB8_9BACT|nr:MAG: pantothenate kinase [Candidatus Omnitrophica bacterium CG07_land_8_20_14_0_80_42_15]